ncbi:MAG: 6-pyruvoyl-tetrahydropterin synthase-related protein, partial [Anaerolineae bacterium]
MDTESKKLGFVASGEAEAPSLTQNPGFWTCATLISVALLAAAPLWGPGIVNTRGGGDSPFLLQRAHQLLVNLRAGVFPVRWMPDAAYGLGYPFFSYYAALPYYLIGLLALVGLDLLTALKLVQTLGFIAAALAMYGWVFRLTENRWAAWLAAVAYTVAPFHLVNVYFRGDSLSEFYAFIFYPLILWSLDGISKSASRRIGPVALAYAGLLLTHNISAMIFSPFALLYLVMLAWREKGNRWRVFGIGIWAFGFGFLLSAWFWLPAVAELGYVQLGSSTQDYFHYSRHFRANNLLQNKLLFDYSTAAGHSVRSPFAMGLAQAGLAVLGGLVLLVRGVRRRLEARWWFVLLGLLISTAMITPLSKPLWDHLPLLPVTQFPWRFLSVQALFTAAATVALVTGQRATRNSLGVTLLVAVLLIASTLLPLRPERLPVNPADVTVERLQLYELFAGNIGSTIRYEWLPNTADPRPYTSDALVEPGALPRAIPLDGASLQATLVEREPIRQTWRVWGDGGGIAFPLLHWPGWTARVDGEPVEVWPVEGSGYLALEVPPGEHTVILRLGRTPVRAVAEAVSLCALVTLVVVLLRARPRIRWPVVARYATIVVLPLLALLLLVQKPGFSEKTRFLSANGTSDLTMDFIQMPYLHHNPGGVDFGGVARLTGYTLSAKELAPGDTLTVTLDWAQMDRAYTATVHLVSPAVVRHDV